jgi:hypothetical protein
MEKSVEEIMLKLTGIDIMMCPFCKKGKMHIVEEIPEKTYVFRSRVISLRRQ